MAEVSVVDVREDAKKLISGPGDITKTFNIRYTDPTGRDYAGDFTVRRLNMGAIRKMAIRKSQLNGGEPDSALDETIVQLNSMLAHLEVALVQAPEWWNPDSFYSGDVIVEVYKEVMSFEDTFRKPSGGES